MKLVEIQWNPTDRQLRQFGLIALVALPLIGWMFSGRPWPGEATATQQAVLAALAAVGALFALFAWLQPRLLRYPFLGAMLLALPIGMVVSELIVLVIYFVLFLPVAIVFRLIGRDALDRRINRNVASYWQPKAPPRGPASYYRQS